VHVGRARVLADGRAQALKQAAHLGRVGHAGGVRQADLVHARFGQLLGHHQRPGRGGLQRRPQRLAQPARLPARSWKKRVLPRVTLPVLAAVVV